MAVQSDLLKGGEPTDRELLAQALLLHLDAFEASELGGIEIRMAWWPSQTFWLVPKELQAEALVIDAIPRGRIFTTAELRRLLARAPTPETLQFMIRAKTFFDGEVET